MTRWVFIALVLCWGGVGCGRSDEPDTAKADGQRFLRCAEPYDDGAKEQFRLPPLTLERRGLSLTIHGITRGLVVLGVLAGISEPSPTTFKNVDFFLEQFKDAGVQAILVPGDVGLREKDMTRVLERLAKAPIPILLTPGAQENFDVFRRVIQRLNKKHKQLIDMTRVRKVHLAHLTIVSLPGYHKPFYLAAGERGCGMLGEDIAKTVDLFDAKRPKVLLSPTPPRGIGVRAVDRGRNGINIGDAALTEILSEHHVQFGVFGYAYEAGGNATYSDGKTPVAPGIWHQSLYLQAGSAEALPEPLVEAGRSVGMAQIVEFSASRGRYRTLDAPMPFTR